ncbi:MAG: aminotransferase class IV, partial [Chloroflexi bacterium]|nr:aminotransferase class IV [Chloroflexota bacterium]
MKIRTFILMTTVLAATALFVACNGGDSDDNGGDTTGTLDSSGIRTEKGLSVAVAGQALGANFGLESADGATSIIATGGIVHTPVPNRTFLDGITRQRVIGLLRDAGTEVVERTLGYAEVCAADEVFSTGNYAKVSPAIRIEDRDLQPGPLY